MKFWLQYDRFPGRSQIFIFLFTMYQRVFSSVVCLNPDHMQSNIGFLDVVLR